MKWSTLPSKLPFEIGSHDLAITRGFRTFEDLASKEILVPGRMILVPGPEFIVIGHQPQLPPRLENPMKRPDRLILKDSSLVMTGLRPRVTEVEMDDPTASFRKSMRDDLRGVVMEHPDIRHGVTPNTIRRESEELPRPLDAEEVGVGLKPRLLDEKRPLAGTDLEFEGIVRSFKPAPGIEGPIPRWRKLIGGDSECTELEVFSA